jgi:Ureidoglycolate lyase
MGNRQVWRRQQRRQKAPRETFCRSIKVVENRHLLLRIWPVNCQDHLYLVRQVTYLIINSMIFETEPLTKESFKVYGDVIESRVGAVPANQGTAIRSNWLTKFDHKDSSPNVCVFKVSPAVLPFTIKLLERYQLLTQTYQLHPNVRANEFIYRFIPGHSCSR